MKTVHYVVLAGVSILSIAAVAVAQNRSFPDPVTREGRPIESRTPEKPDAKPAFPGQTRAPYRASIPYAVTTITDALDTPWALAFLPDGKFLVTEKGGAMRIVDAKGARSQPITGVPAVAARGQGGLLDLALDPDFARNRRIFFSYSQPRGTDEHGIAIARARLNEAGTALENVTVIFQATPALSGRTANQGSRIVFAPDGNLFATIGDRSSGGPWLRAQELNTHLGKIIRITQDGKPAPGNPFLNRAGVLPEIYSIGHRSEQGLTIDSATGRLWEVEHGARGGDELNTPEAGKNYGWPVVTYGVDYSGATIGEGITQKDGMEQPLYYWDPVIAPSGLAVYNGNLFPQWKGNIFVTALRGQMMVRLALSGDRVVAEEPLLTDQGARLRDVRVGPDGAIYVLTESGRLLKITPR